MKNTITNLRKQVPILFFIPMLILIFPKNSISSVVTGLSAFYKDGQVFLTWTNPTGTNKLQYNVYRSTTKITGSSQLTSSNFIGFVRENSSKNLFWTTLEGKDFYYKITNGGTALSSTQGFYVATSVANQSYYYAVTVTTVSTSSEDKTITDGDNSLSYSLAETIAKPLPVFQDSTILTSGEVRYHYVLYGDNLSTSLFPSLNSVGTYGFDFFLGKRGSAPSYPLFVLYDGTGGTPDEGFDLDATFDNCYILGVYDWLPVPHGSNPVGEATYFTGFHEKFNIYSNSNPYPTTGTVNMYQQRKVVEAIKYMQANYAIDTTKLYLKGTSANGFGAMMTALTIPEKVAAVYSVVEPVSLASVSDTKKQMWGENSAKLNSDMNDWETGDPIIFNTVNNLNKMININAGRNLPVIYDVHGKNDNTVGWDDGKVGWLDSLNAARVGGKFFWDQRKHDGSGKDFSAEETRPDFYRFATNKSFPAFSNCSINQDPGNGNKTSGADYGAFNGYLDFTDDNISDNSCDYTVHVFVKDLYVNGVLDAEQYSTCTTDLTFRRLQNFKPASGVTLKWWNYDEVTGATIQNGKLTYNGGLVTLTGLTINKTGNKIYIKIKNCTAKLDEETEAADNKFYFSKTIDGYAMHYTSDLNEDIKVSVYDLLGREVSSKKISITTGENTLNVTAPSAGIYFVQLKGSSVQYVEKLMY